MSRGPDVQPLIDYYAREGYYRHVQTICKEVLKKRANDPVLRFWKTFGVCMEGGSGPNQAIREFEELQNSVDVKVASSAACLHAHKLCRLVDQEAVEMLELKVQSDQARAKPSDLLQAASFYCHVGQFNDARDLVNNVLEREQNNQAAQNLRGWVDLLCGREAMANKSIRYFESANGISKVRARAGAPACPSPLGLSPAAGKGSVFGLGSAEFAAVGRCRTSRACSGSQSSTRRSGETRPALALPCSGIYPGGSCPAERALVEATGGRLALDLADASQHALIAGPVRRRRRNGT